MYTACFLFTHSDYMVHLEHCYIFHVELLLDELIGNECFPFSYMLMGSF
jgi:hypothetical protein